MFCVSCLVCGLVVVGGYSVFGLHPIRGFGGGYFRLYSCNFQMVSFFLGMILFCF